MQYVLQFHESRDHYKAQIADVANEIQALIDQGQSRPKTFQSTVGDPALTSRVEAEVVRVLCEELPGKLDSARFDIFLKFFNSEAEIYRKTWDALQTTLAIAEVIFARTRVSLPTTGTGHGISSN